MSSVVARSFLLLALLLNFAMAKEYDLPAILQLADQKNRDIQLARSELKIASAEKLAAYSRAFPKLNVDAGYNRNFLENIVFFRLNGQTQSFKTSFRNEYRLTASLNQTLFSYEVGVAIQAARYFNKMTQYQFDATRQFVLARVKKAFYQVLLLREVYQVARDSEESARDNYLNIKEKFENGIVSEFDLLQAEVRWQNAIPETIKARKDLDLAINNLKVMAGIPLDDEVTLQGTLETFPPLPEALTLEDVTGHRPDFNALVWEKKLREKNVSAQKSDFFPSLNASLQYLYTAASDRFKLEQDNDNIVLGVSLHIPIFSGGNTIANVRKARAEVEKVKTRIDQTTDNIRIDLLNIRLRLREARQRIDAARHGVQTARRAYEIAEVRVQNQLSTQVELKENRVALDRAQVNYYSAIFDYLNAYFDWQLSIGAVSERSVF